MLQNSIGWVSKWIVTLAVWGWLPLRVAKWVIPRAGHHENQG